VSASEDGLGPGPDSEPPSFEPVARMERVRAEVVLSSSGGSVTLLSAAADLKEPPEGVEQLGSQCRV
jgi:hypothetical protein